MRRKLLVLVACLMVAGVVSAGPATANEPLRGDQVMVLNQDPDTLELGLHGCSEISWFGSIEIDDTTYGMALYPLPGRFTGRDMVLHYEESWKVWSEEFSLSDEGLVEDCTPGVVLLSGTDSGLWTMKNGKFRSNGVVEEAFEPFEDWQGRQVHQDGVIGPIDFGGLEGVVIGFYGDLRLN